MQGSFTLQRPRIVTPGTYIGGRKDGAKAFVSSLHGIELYSTQSPQPIPQTLKELIIKTQQIKRFPPKFIPAWHSTKTVKMYVTVSETKITSCSLSLPTGPPGLS